MTTRLERGTTKIARTRLADAHTGSSESAVDAEADVSGRIASVRTEVFELVEELHRRDDRRWTDFERASEQMQSIANQLAAVQVLVARAGR
jgi:hypothetical protein